MADKHILEFVQSSKNIIDADSGGENEMNNAASVPTSSKMRNIMKSHGPRVRGNPTMDTVHRRVRSTDRDARTLSEGRIGRRCAFNIATFRIVFPISTDYELAVSRTGTLKHKEKIVAWHVSSVPKRKRGSEEELQRTNTGKWTEESRVQYFVRGGFVGYRSRASSKHLSSHLPVDELDSSGSKGVALQLQMHVGVGSTKKAD
ncbi:hypothetical protein TNCV_1247761 [Trichonephila clavipes]|nr:hypothetical protein TNCV_1247761 [Trichonephila clavipes]